MKVLLAVFLDQFNCFDWKDFLKKCLPFLYQAVLEKSEGNRSIEVAQDENFKSNCKFLNNLTIVDTKDNLTISDSPSDDFTRLRERPLYQVSEGVFRIIYGLFFVEVIYKGMFFRLQKIHEQTNDSKKKKKDFGGIYKDKFSEKFLLYKVLEGIYCSDTYIKFSEVAIKECHARMKKSDIKFDEKAENEELPDYYIRKQDENILFLFESKDIKVNKAIKPTYDFEQYKKTFKEKFYYVTKENGKIAKKSVLQLIKNIERALTKKFSFDTDYDEKFLSIYPIVIVHDRQFSDVLGLNRLVKSWFDEELIELKHKGINIDKVRPITIINIDTFICYQDILMNGTIELDLILDEYFYTLFFNGKKRYRNKNEEYQYFIRTLAPFSDFLVGYLKKQISDDPGKIPIKLEEKVLQFLHS